MWTPILNGWLAFVRTWLGEVAMSVDFDLLLANPDPLAFYQSDSCLQQALTAFLELHQPTHLVTATLFHESSALKLEDALNDWVIRVNRCYLGRRWYVPTFKPKTMQAFMYVVGGLRSDDHHAALLVKVPTTADHQDFTVRAPLFFAMEFQQAFPPIGDMTAELITPDQSLGETVLLFMKKLSLF